MSGSAMTITSGMRARTMEHNFAHVHLIPTSTLQSTTSQLECKTSPTTSGIPALSKPTLHCHQSLSLNETFLPTPHTLASIPPAARPIGTRATKVRVLHSSRSSHRNCQRRKILIHGIRRLWKRKQDDIRMDPIHSPRQSHRTVSWPQPRPRKFSPS